MKILIVKDDLASMMLLKKRVENMGFQVFTAKTGAEALHILHREDIRLVVTDWVMPEIDGATLCRLIRSMKTPGYVYIIFLTARANKEDLIEGIRAGADDYLAKPFDADELQMRISAGVRILKLERSLLEKNEIIRRDLEAARELQKSFLPKKVPIMANLEFAERFVPSAYVSGDIYSIFRLDERHFGFYHVDVMGHGVLAALFSLNIHQRLSHDLYPFGLLKIPIESEPYYKLNPPIEVIRILNQESLLEQYGSYFTMLYATLDIVSGRLSLYRAGHNYPLIIPTRDEARYLREGGPPVGLGIPMRDEDALEIQLDPGDTFVVFSDGITECRSGTNPELEYGFDRAGKILMNSRSFSIDESFDRLMSDVSAFHGGSEFDDDVSIMGLRWKGRRT